MCKTVHVCVCVCVYAPVQSAACWRCVSSPQAPVWFSSWIQWFLQRWQTPARPRRAPPLTAQPEIKSEKMIRNESTMLKVWESIRRVCHWPLCVTLRWQNGVSPVQIFPSHPGSSWCSAAWPQREGRPRLAVQGGGSAGRDAPGCRWSESWSLRPVRRQKYKTRVRGEYFSWYTNYFSLTPGIAQKLCIAIKSVERTKLLLNSDKKFVHSHEVFLRSFDVKVLWKHLFSITQHVINRRLCEFIHQDHFPEVPCSDSGFHTVAGRCQMIYKKTQHKCK